MDIPDPSIFLGGVPTQNVHRYFADMTGQMTVGLWDSTPFERAVAPFPRCELMCILEGSVTLTDGEGTAHRLGAGEATYIPMGALSGWKSTEYVRKFFAIFQPAAAASARQSASTVTSARWVSAPPPPSRQAAATSSAASSLRR